MHIRVMSDLHLEFESPRHDAKHFQITPLPSDKDSILILAGDIGLLEKSYTYQEFIERACDQFKRVVWVYGNHEYYKGNWPWSHNVADKLFMDIGNLHYGYEFVAIVDNLAIVCSTLWTDYDKKDPLVMWACMNTMNDHRLIRTGPKAEPWRDRFNPEDAARFHDTSKDFIIDNIQKYQAEGKTVIVVTHHAPTQQSIHDKYKGDKCNGAYASNLYDLVETSNVPFWFHGHVHDSFNYMIGNTNVITNPRGYIHEENPNFDPILIFEV